MKRRRTDGLQTAPRYVSGGSRTNLTLAVILVLAGAAVYGNSVSLPFVFDDQRSIVDNPSIRDWSSAAALAPDRERPTSGRPLVNFSFALNYAAGGLGVRGYRAVNIALHLLSTLLIFAIARRTLAMPAMAQRFEPREPWVSFAIALLWMIHPLNTEAVDYATQRTELMMALFYLLTLYAAIRARQDASPRWTVTAIAVCAAGMACKESMATAPIAVALYDRVFLFESLKQALRVRWRMYAGLAAGWLLLATLVAEGPRAHSAGFSSGVSPWTYLLNQFVMIVQYLKLTVWPRGLVANYGWPQPLTFADVVPQTVAVIGFGAIAIAALVRYPPAGFALAWFFITLAPTSSIVPIATEVGAERRMYLPLVGLIAVTVGGLASIRRLPRPAFTAAIVACAIGLAAGTVARNREYASALRLAETTVERHPTSYAHHYLAIELLHAGRRDEAMQHLRRAVPGAPRAHYTLGVELFKAGQLDEAIVELQTFVREQPILVEAVAARQLLGRAYALQRQWPRAIENYETVLTMNPTRVQRIETEGLLGEAQLEAGNFERAARHFAEFARGRPGDADALIKLGVALVNMNRMDDALGAFQGAVEADPRNADAQRNLANALFERRDAAAAAVHARRAVELRPEDAGAHNVLGRALAAQGRFADGLRELETAVRLAPQDAVARDDLTRLRAMVRR